MTADIRAHSGKTLEDMMPTDEELRSAGEVVSLDGFYWFNGYREGCERAKAAAEHLFSVRGDRPMILATVPGNFGVKDCINPVLRERCTGKCVLIEPEEFSGLHPDQDYIDRNLKRLYELETP